MIALLLHLVGRFIILFSASPSLSRSSGSTCSDGTCRRHSNDQVSKGVDTRLLEYLR